MAAMMDRQQIHATIVLASPTLKGFANLSVAAQAHSAAPGKTYGF
jgi:hypothetical protein